MDEARGELLTRSGGEAADDRSGARAEPAPARPAETDQLRVTVLGCGSSGGVPRLGGEDGAGHWGDCDPSDPKNRRRRCALLVERAAAAGVTRVLIDCGPDIREQLLDAEVGVLDAVILTHDHADHTHGLDDLRQCVINTRRRIDVWADARTADIITRRFDYLFETPEGSDYPPVADLRLIEEDQIDGGAPVVVDGAGGRIEARAFRAIHGRVTALGFRIARFAYLPDANILPEPAWPLLDGLDLFIVDALRYRAHPSHANLDTALAWIARADPRRAVLTNMHCDLDYARVADETPPHVTPAHDGLVLRTPAD